MGWDLCRYADKGFCIKGNVVRETVYWKLDLEHSLVASVHARLLARLTSVNGCLFIPRCQIEVWAEGKLLLPSDGSELSFCRGFVDLNEPTAFVEWLGRRGGKPAHESVRGVGCFPNEQAGEGDPRTVPQTCLGLFAALAQLFGASRLELEPQDNGSGRLIQYYRAMGLEVAKLSSKLKVISMNGPIEGVAALAPSSWLPQLKPPDFDVGNWFMKRARITHTGGSNYVSVLRESSHLFQPSEATVAGLESKVAAHPAMLIDMARIPGASLPVPVPVVAGSDLARPVSSASAATVAPLPGVVNEAGMPPVLPPEMHLPSSLETSSPPKRRNAAQVMREEEEEALARRRVSRLGTPQMRASMHHMSSLAWSRRQFRGLEQTLENLKMRLLPAHRR